MPALTVELGESSELGPCDCCGGRSRTVWGYLHRGETTEAAYFVQWTLGQVDRHGANFDLIVGKWGDGTIRHDRRAVALELRHGEAGPAFTVIDAADRPVGGSELVGKALSRGEVIGTPLAAAVFEMVDAIWLQDERIAEVAA
jgi:hypothetical protein